MNLFAPPKRLIPLFFIVGWLAGAMPVPAQRSAPIVEVSANPDTIVVQYTQIHHLLADPDPTPLLRVYANGRVHIHYPVYMAKAGDYELWLSPTELRELLVGLAEDGVMDFDPVAETTARRRAKAAERARGELHHVSDVTETAIDIRLDFYQPAAAPPRSNLQKSVRWRNVDADARRYPELTGVRGIATAEGRLRGLLQRSDLVKLR